MSLTNVEIMKQTIGLASYEDEWIQNSMVSTSPYGDFIVISSSSCAVFYIKKYVSNVKKKLDSKEEEHIKNKNISTPIFQILRTYHPISETSGSITAVCYLPVKVVSSSGRTHDMWHCVVIGYETGLLEIIAAESGDVLISKQFSKPGGGLNGYKVTNIQYLATPASNTSLHRSQNSHLTEALAIPKLQELIVVMDSTLAVLESSVLFSALLKNKSEITATRTNGIERTRKVNSVPFKRYKVKEQSKIVNAVAYAVPNVPLDQYHQISMKKELLNEEHLRTLKFITTYVTVGSDPFIQHNCPHQLGPQNINELAANVVSTVKSGLFRAATGFIGSWAGGNSENDDPVDQPDPEQSLHIRHAFKDNTKTAVCIKISPDGRYTAILDEHNRVLLLDNTVNGNGAGSGTVVHIWKGYHHAQIGWITTSWEERKSDKPDKIPQDLEITVLLLLYLPRRGLLEVWSPEQMFRVVEFPVGKHGKLVSCTNALLDENNIPTPFSVRTIGECVFLEPSGAIKHIYVPIHSLTTKSSSHDTIIRKQLFALATNDKITENDATEQSVSSPEEDAAVTKKITDLILSVKSTMGKIEMLIDMFHVWKIAGSNNQRMVLEAVASQLSQSPIASARCSELYDIIDFYDFLMEKYSNSLSIASDKNCDSDRAIFRDTVMEILDCSSKDADNLLNVYGNSNCSNIETNQENEELALNFSSFISCFDLKYSSFGEADNNSDTKSCKIRLKSKCTTANMKLFCHAIAIAASVDFDGIEELMRSKRIADGHALIHNFLNNTIKYCDLKSTISTIEWIQNYLHSKTFRSFCKLAFSLHETNGDGSSFQTLIQAARQLLVRNNSISFATYAVTLAWKNFLFGGTKGGGEPRFKSYVAEWQHAMFLMEGFIAIAKSANEKLFSYTQEGKILNSKYTLQEVFNAGDGRISEILVQWLLDRDITLSDINTNDQLQNNEESTTPSSMDVDEEDNAGQITKCHIDFDVNKFMFTCKEYFPMSSRRDIIICHMAWEYLHRWSKNHRNLDALIDGAMSCLHSIQQPFVQHRLTALAWTTFVSKTVIESVNLTENRSSTRCEREVGFHESLLPCFLNASTKMLRLLVNTAEIDNSNSCDNDEDLCYDDVTLMVNITGGSIVKKQHLMDHIRGNMRSSDTDIVAVQYQFVAVANAIWTFGIDSIKPLSLFNSQESNLFFQGSPSSSTFISSTFQSLNMLQSEHSRSVRHCRRRFLEAACDGAVACIHQMLDGKRDCKEYDNWCNILVLLAKMWHLPEKLREMQIVSLYRAGHDTLGAELMNLLSDRTSIGHKLLHVCLLRLSKHIYFGGIDGSSCPQTEAKAKIAALTVANSNLTKQLETIKNEATKNLPANSSLKDTSDLLILLSGLELEEQSQQLAYECLALTQSLRP